MHIPEEILKQTPKGTHKQIPMPIPEQPPKQIHKQIQQKNIEGQELSIQKGVVPRAPAYGA